MALGDTYATLPQLKAYVRIADSVDDVELTDALESASRAVEEFCNRQFNDAGSATPRTYYAEHRCLVEPADFHTTAGLEVRTDEDDDGVFETVWSSSDFQLEPLDGVVSGQVGWPFWRVLAVGARTFPTCGRRAGVQVTAQWGWAAVPRSVKKATLLQASRLGSRRDSPYGIAGSPEIGSELRLLAKVDADVQVLLQPYVREPVLVA